MMKKKINFQSKKKKHIHNCVKCGVHSWEGLSGERVEVTVTLDLGPTSHAAIVRILISPWKIVRVVT